MAFSYTDLPIFVLRKKGSKGEEENENGPVVYPADVFNSHLRGDSVPLGSSPTKISKKLTN